MKSIASPNIAAVSPAVSQGAESAERSATVASRLADFIELTKPRIAVLVLFTVAAGAFLARPVWSDLPQLFHALVGATLAAAGASALNQLLERRSDALMRRTENRPLPSGRLQPGEVLLFGLTLALGGLVYMACTMTHLLAAAVTAATIVGYVLVYTPLKRHTAWNTLIGAVPGALPPLIGWTAMRGTLEWEGLILPLIVLLWQVPHFLAIAWMYREDYGRAGLRMIPVGDETGGRTSRHVIVFGVALLGFTLIPVLTGHLGLVYGLGAALAGVYFLAAGVRFARHRGFAEARRLLHASLLYLPLILLLLMLECWLGPVKVW